MQPGLDIVVVNWRTPGDLQSFLESVRQHPPSCPYIVWIMNVEPERFDTAVAEEWVKAHRFVGYHIPFAVNVGYARACNRGAAHGEFDVIACFNADVKVTEGALDECRDALIGGADRRWGVLGPRQVNDAGRHVHAGIFGTLDAPAIRGWNTKDRGQFNDVRDDGVSVSGSAYFVTRPVWEELAACPDFRAVDPTAEGAFLTTEHYYEETFCSYHAQAHGYRIVYLGTTCITHRWHKASPLGGRAEQVLPESRRRFRKACAAHGIPCD